MAKAMQGPEIFWEAGHLLDAIHLLGYIHTSLAPPAWEDVRATGVGVRFQEFSGSLIQGYLLILAALGVTDMDEAPLKIHVLPLQPK